MFTGCICLYENDAVAMENDSSCNYVPQKPRICLTVLSQRWMKLIHVIKSVYWGMESWIIVRSERVVSIIFVIDLFLKVIGKFLYIPYYCWFSKVYITEFLWTYGLTDVGTLCLRFSSAFQPVNSRVALLWLIYETAFNKMVRFVSRPALTVLLRTRVGPVFHMEYSCALTVLGSIAPWECTWALSGWFDSL